MSKPSLLCYMLDMSVTLSGICCASSVAASGGMGHAIHRVPCWCAGGSRMDSRESQGHSEGVPVICKRILSGQQRRSRPFTWCPAGVQEDPEWTAEKELCQRRGIPYVKPEAKKAAGEDEFAEEAELLEVGQRCQCAPASRRGTIRCAFCPPSS